MTKRGRPSYVPTDEEKEKVKQLVAVSAPIADIAKALGKSEPTLRKYFSAYLIFPKKNKPAPEVQITQAQRDKVILYLGCKMSVADVGRVFGLTVEQMEQHFPEELATAHAKYRAKVLEKLDAQMDVGTVGATNRLEAITVIPDGDESPGERKGPHVGKKAGAAAAAGAAIIGGGRFAPRPSPKIAVDNTK